MPVNIVWDDAAKTILRMDITSPGVSWDEYNSRIDDMITLTKDVEHRVDIVINAGATPMSPGSPIPHIRRTFKLLPSHVHLLVNVVTDRFARVIVVAVGPMVFGNNFKAVETLEDARTVIDKDRATVKR